jgi:hypothetical protein
MAITSANQLELLQTAEAVAREKMIDAELVIQAMEDSLARAAKSRYGADLDIRVKIDRKTGRATFARVRTVVEDEGVENHHAQLTVAQARQYLPDPKIGDEIVDEVPPVDLGRIGDRGVIQEDVDHLLCVVACRSCVPQSEWSEAVGVNVFGCSLEFGKGCNGLTALSRILVIDFKEQSLIALHDKWSVSHYEPS